MEKRPAPQHCLPGNRRLTVQFKKITFAEPAERPKHGVCAVLPGAGLPGAPPHDDSPDAGQKEGEKRGRIMDGDLTLALVLKA